MFHGAELLQIQQLAIEENKKITLTEAQILAFLDYVCEMPADDVNKRRAIINIFVHSIYLYDDHFTLIINASKKPLSIDNIPLDDIETAFEGETGALEGCSSLSTPCSTKVLIFFGKSGLFAICGTFEKIEEIETGHTALKMKCFCGMPLIFFEWRAIIDLRVRTN